MSGVNSYLSHANSLAKPVALRLAMFGLFYFYFQTYPAFFCGPKLGRDAETIVLFLTYLYCRTQLFSFYG